MLGARLGLFECPECLTTGSIGRLSGRAWSEGCVSWFEDVRVMGGHFMMGFEIC